MSGYVESASSGDEGEGIESDDDVITDDFDALAGYDKQLVARAMETIGMVPSDFSYEKRRHLGARDAADGDDCGPDSDNIGGNESNNDDDCTETDDIGAEKSSGYVDDLLADRKSIPKQQFVPFSSGSLGSAQPLSAANAVAPARLTSQLNANPTATKVNGGKTTQARSTTAAPDLAQADLADEQASQEHLDTLIGCIAALRTVSDLPSVSCIDDVVFRMEEMQREAEERLVQRRRVRLARENEAKRGVGFPFDWNEAFQRAAEHADDSDETLVHKRRQLAELSRDFTHYAKMFGKVIITEKNLKSEHKTIRPVEVGGIAGGEKFVVHGIYFKFATDNEGIYGSDEAAAKAASHELMAVMRLYGQEGLHTPLMTLISHKGYRLIAMTILPIVGSRTLVYGSRDAGRTVFNNDPTMDMLCKRAGSALNLKQHVAGIAVPPHLAGQVHVQSATLSLPADIEGHVGTDGRRYLLDFSRLFPPECPDVHANVRGSVFFRQLRPEFVRRWPRPLSSDAFTNFGFVDRDIHNAEVAAATVYIRGRGVRLFARKLEVMYAQQCELMARAASSSMANVVDMLNTGRLTSADTTLASRSSTASPKSSLFSGNRVVYKSMISFSGSSSSDDINNDEEALTSSGDRSHGTGKRWPDAGPNSGSVENEVIYRSSSANGDSRLSMHSQGRIRRSSSDAGAGQIQDRTTRSIAVSTLHISQPVAADIITGDIEHSSASSSVSVSLAKSRDIEHSSASTTEPGSPAKSGPGIIMHAVSERTRAAVYEQFVIADLLARNQLVQSMHTDGLNIRHLGLVRRRLRVCSKRYGDVWDDTIPDTPSQVLCRCVLVECVARAVKAMLNFRLRHIQGAGTEDDGRLSDSKSRKQILDFFNLLLGTNPGARPFWCQVGQGTMKDQLIKQFGKELLSKLEMAENFDLRTRVDVRALFEHVQKLTGVQFKRRVSVEVAAACIKNTKGVDIRFAGIVLCAADISKIRTIVKNLHLVSLAEAHALANQARSWEISAAVGGQQGTRANSRGVANKLFDLSREKFDSAVAAVPDSALVHRLYAQALLDYAVVDPVARSALLRSAFERFVLSAQLAESDPMAHDGLASSKFLNLAAVGISEIRRVISAPEDIPSPHTSTASSLNSSATGWAELSMESLYNLTVRTELEQLVLDCVEWELSFIDETKTPRIAAAIARRGTAVLLSRVKRKFFLSRIQSLQERDLASKYFRLAFDWDAEGTCAELDLPLEPLMAMLSAPNPVDPTCLLLLFESAREHPRRMLRPSNSSDLGEIPTVSSPNQTPAHSGTFSTIMVGAASFSVARWPLSRVGAGRVDFPPQGATSTELASVCSYLPAGAVRVFDLSENQVGDLDLEFLQEYAEVFSGLEELRLNKVVGLSAAAVEIIVQATFGGSMNPSSLRVLCLKDCHALTDASIRHILPSVSATLIELKLSGSRNITDAGWRAIAVALPRIEVLKANYCSKISSSTFGVVCSTWTRLRELCIVNCSSFNKHHVRQLAKSVPTTLRRLNIAMSSLSHSDLESIKDLTALNRLDVSTSEKVRRLRSIAPLGPQLFELSCKNLPLVSATPQYIAEDIACMFGAPSLVQRLSLRDIPIKNESLAHIAQACGAHLRELDISSSEELRSLAPLTVYCPNLTGLAISGCKRISVQDMIDFIKTSGSSLRKLDLRWCRITNKGVKTIMENCRKLRELKMTECISISDAAFTSPHTNADADLHRASFGTLRARQGGTSFIPDSLEVLDLKGCVRIGDGTLNSLCDSCPKLARLDIQRCLGVTPLGLSRARNTYSVITISHDPLPELSKTRTAVAAVAPGSQRST